MTDLKHSYNWSARSIETYRVRPEGFIAACMNNVKGLFSSLVSSRGYGYRR